jgi:hypothetical protein
VRFVLLVLAGVSAIALAILVSRDVAHVMRPHPSHDPYQKAVRETAGGMP